MRAEYRGSESFRISFYVQGVSRQPSARDLRKVPFVEMIAWGFTRRVLMRFSGSRIRVKGVRLRAPGLGGIGGFAQKWGHWGP